MIARFVRLIEADLDPVTAAMCESHVCGECLSYFLKMASFATDAGNSVRLIPDPRSPIPDPRFPIREASGE
jgi:hypothetical protein